MIDKNSITVTPTEDPNVVIVQFDFTDDTVDPASGYNARWSTASFRFNTNMSDGTFMALANEAMDKVRKSSQMKTLETTLREKFGTTVNRMPPAVDVPMRVKIVDVAENIVISASKIDQEVI